MKDVSDLRWHPFLREWVGVAANRQNRPQLPKNWCPFCPGSGNVPDQYDVLIYPNDFAALSAENRPFDPSEAHLYGSTGARGSCDVVLYHSDHNLAPSQMSAHRWRQVVDLWTSRSIELAANPDVVQVFIFENTGEAIGVTMPHPHGQIYAFPFIPPLIQRELDAASAEADCLYCKVLHEEIAQAKRLVCDNSSFVAFVPFWARWPTEVQLYARRHVASLADLTDAEKTDLANIIKQIRVKYDHLYGFPMPLMMLVRQAPVRGTHEYFHFHVAFFPIQRSATKIKFLAGIESGAGTFLNDTVAEDRAEELRNTEPR